MFQLSFPLGFVTGDLFFWGNFILYYYILNPKKRKDNSVLTRTILVLCVSSWRKHTNQNRHNCTIVQNLANLLS